MQLARIGMFLALVAPLGAATMIACSSSSSGSGSGSDGGSEAASGQDSGGGGSDSGSGDGGGDDASASTVCNNLTPGSKVPITFVGGNPPTATGGSIADGTYAVASAKIYTGNIDAGGGAAGTTDTKMQVQGTTVNVAQTSNGKVTSETDTFAISGPSLTITPTCPSGHTGTTAQFSALDPNADAGVPNGGFTLYVQAKGVVAEITLAKQ